MNQKEYTDAEIDLAIEHLKDLDISEEKKARQIELFEAMRPENKQPVLATEAELDAVFGVSDTSKSTEKPKSDMQKEIDQIFGKL